MRILKTRGVCPAVSRILITLLCTCAGVILVPGVLLAQAQPNDQAAVSASSQATPDTTQARADSIRLAEAEKAKEDSLAELERARGLEGVPTMGPIRYRTGYTLNRSTANWDQNLGFDFSARGISVSTQVSGTVYSDTETKNDRRNSTSILSIGYAASERLSVGLDLNFARLNDHFLKKHYTTNQVSAKAAYSLPKSDRFSATMPATAGSLDEVKPTYTGAGTTSSLLFDSMYGFAFPCTLRVNASGELTNRRSQDVKTALKTHDKDLKELLNATMALIPFSGSTLTLGLGKSNSRLQYPSLGQQETWTSKSTTLDANLAIYTKRDVTVKATGNYQNSDITYAVDKTQSSTFLSKSFSADLTVPALLGASLTSNFDLEDANSVMGSGRNGDVKTKALAGRISRRLTHAISSEIIGNVSLVQYLFFDPSSRADDRDVYKDAISIGLALGSPGSRYTGSASIKRDLEKMVYVRSANSGNNRNTELYSALGSFVYKRGRLIFTQTATTTMNYTLFHFFGDQNALSRTTSISSTLDFPWADKAAFKLTHSYRIQDSGSYLTPPGGDHALYRRAGGSITDELYLITEYKLTADLNISIGNRFQQSRNFTLHGGKKVFSYPRKVVELLENFRIAYDMGGGSLLQMTLTRTLSAFGMSYWNATATFSRQFF